MFNAREFICLYSYVVTLHFPESSRSAVRNTLRRRGFSVGAELPRGHRPVISPPSITSGVDMSFQLSFSKLKKKAKARLLRSTPEPETGETDNGGVEPRDWRLQSTPHVGVIEDGGNFNSRVGGSDGMCAS